MTPKIESPYLHGWDDEKVYFYDAKEPEHCVSDESELMEKLIAICREFYKNYPSRMPTLKKNQIQK